MAIDLVTFKQQLLRLLRESWPNPQMLAEETYAVLSQLQDSPDTGPTTLANDGQDPVLTVHPLSDDTPPIEFRNPDGTPAGSIVIKNGKPTIVDRHGDETTNNGGGGIPGQVMSGSGDTYLVALYPNGKNFATAGEVSVKQLQIADDETIPAGTWVIVTQTGSVYSMQAPVWM